MYASQLLPVLAAIGYAVADCSGPSTTISSPADATGLASCDSYDGDVIIDGSAGPTIQLNGLKSITGDLSCENAASLTALTSNSITEVGGIFNLTNLQVISNLQFDELESVGSLDFTGLPALSALNFPKSISKATSVSIINTFLSSLDGIDLDDATDFRISNNNRLTKFNTQISTIKGSLNIDSNGKSLDVEFPNLIWAANMTVRNVSTLTIPSLAVVNGSLGLYENYFQSLSCPNLSTIGIQPSGNDGGLAVVSNALLSNMSFPQLTKSGGALQVANNSLLNDISFPQLTYVGGAVQFNGNTTTPELPKISNVVGAFSIQSTQQIDCSKFDSERGSAIQGKYTCTTNNNALTAGTSTASGSSASSTKKSSASQFGINEAAAGLSVVGSLLQFIL